MCFLWRVPLDKIKICKIFKKSFSKHQKVFRKLWKRVLKILKRKFSKFFSQMPCLDLHATSHHPNVDGGCVQPHLWHLACKLIQCTYFGLVPVVDNFIAIPYTLINYDIFIIDHIGLYINHIPIFQLKMADIYILILHISEVQ